MKMNTGELLRKAQAPILVGTTLMPLSLFLFGIFAPEHVAMAWLLFGAFVLLAEISLLIPGKWRLAFGILGVVAISWVNARIASYTESNWLLLLLVLYGPALLAMMPVAAWSWHMELPPIVCYVSIGLFLMVQTLAYLMVDRFPMLSEVISIHMTVSFLLFALLTLLGMNRNTLNSAAVQRHKASLNVRRKNRMLVLGFFLLVTFLVATPAIMDAVWSAFLWILAKIRELRELLRGDKDPTLSTIPTGTPEIGEMGDLGGGDTLFARIMRAVFYVLSMIAPAALILFIAFFLFKKAPVLMRKLRKMMASFHRFADAASEDYDEEITDTRDHDTVKRLKIRTERWLRPAEERRMEPGQRVRYRYRRLLKKHPEWTQDKTARENLPEDPAGIYERARYSREAVTEEEAKQFAADIKKV